MARHRSTAVFAGVVLVALGLWGALLPLVGPYFDFGFSPDSTWHLTADRVWLSVIPGAGAVVGGVMLIVARRRATAIAGAALALAAGTWFVLGPAVSLLWTGGLTPQAVGRPLGHHGRAALELLAGFYALGIVIAVAAIAAMASTATRVRVAVAAPDADLEALRDPAPALRGGELVV